MSAIWVWNSGIGAGYYYSLKEAVHHVLFLEGFSERNITISKIVRCKPITKHFKKKIYNSVVYVYVKIENGFDEFPFTFVRLHYYPDVKIFEL